MHPPRLAEPGTERNVLDEAAFAPEDTAATRGSEPRSLRDPGQRASRCEAVLERRQEARTPDTLPPRPHPRPLSLAEEPGPLTHQGTGRARLTPWAHLPERASGQHPVLWDSTSRPGQCLRPVGACLGWAQPPLGLPEAGAAGVGGDTSGCRGSPWAPHLTTPVQGPLGLTPSRPLLSRRLGAAPVAPEDIPTTGPGGVSELA